MTTNTGIPKDSELYRKGQALIEAAYEYWQEYQKTCTPVAVVWLEAENGHFVLFTRSEYKAGIIYASGVETGGEPPLERMFESSPSVSDRPLVLVARDKQDS